MGLGLSKKEKVSWAPVSSLDASWPQMQCDQLPWVLAAGHSTMTDCTHIVWAPGNPSFHCSCQVCVIAIRTAADTVEHLRAQSSGICMDISWLHMVISHCYRDCCSKLKPRSSIPGLCLPSWNAHSTQNTAGWKGSDLGPFYFYLVAFQQLKVRASQVYSIWKRSKL